jgi:hypothetical protein
MDALFGELPLPAKFLIAFLVVLALIGIVAYFVRRFGSSGLGATGARGRQPRLAVIEAAAVDARRRLLLIRRDNVEHLVLVGGPADVVVETNINRAARDAARPATPEPAVVRPPAEEPLRPPPAPEPRLRPTALEPIMPDESPLIPPAEPARLHPGDRIPGLEMPRAPARPEPSFPPSPRPVQEPKRPAAPKEISAEEQNLAAMAQRLEAALRRPPGGEPPPRPVQRPTIDAVIPTPRQPVAEPRVEARVEPRMTEPPPPPPPAPAAEPLSPEPAPEAARETREPTAEQKTEAQNVFESLEQEMASLLGRPTGKP